MGAPKGNLNALRTGRRANRRNFVLAKLGPEYATVVQHLHRLRKALEAHARRTDGQIDLKDQDLINLAIRHEMVALVAQKQISEGQSKDVVVDLKTIAWATQRRSEAVAKLNLDSVGGGDGGNPWEVMDRAAADANRMQAETAPGQKAPGGVVSGPAAPFSQRENSPPTGRTT